MQNTIKISDACAIALHAITYIAEQKGRPCSAAQIAARYRASKDHTSKVMQRLNKAGFITSVKGPSGGSVINKNKKLITFFEIYEAIDGEMACSACLLKDKACKKNEKCIMGRTVKDMNKLFKDYLKKTVIYKKN